ncbi:UNVERIFIED_CONTAM: hypothetical protein Sradi_0753100 [Sesamum radiatum]|uniref:GRF-type domain-containing protein n=1 Tax=Sesamum radiatum TaxID=300843 RepID=A0AAW2VQ82_SESRA
MLLSCQFTPFIGTSAQPSLHFIPPLQPCFHLASFNHHRAQIQLAGCSTSKSKGYHLVILKKGVTLAHELKGNTSSGYRSACSSNARLRKQFDSNNSMDDETVIHVCNCGLQVVIRTAWTTANPGKRFCGCPGTNGSYCRTFAWVDPPMCQRSKEVIPGLLKRLSRSDALIEELNQRITLLQSNRQRSTKFLVMVPLSTAFLLMAIVAYLWIH